jgi:hypothetical protein
MKKLLEFTAISLLATLLIYSIANIHINPFWMVGMVVYTSYVLFFIIRDMIEEKKKIRQFTMMELITVMTITAVLLTIGLKGLKVDTSKAAIIQVGENLKLYKQKALSEKTTYRIEITAQELEVYDIDDELIHGEELKHIVTFYTPPNEPTVTEESVVINERGELEGRSSELKLWVSNRPLRMNIFLGKVTYY